MRYWERLLAALCLALLLCAPGARAAETTEAVLSASQVYVNDQRVSVSGYMIDGSTYFRLRDLAAALSGTPGQFDVFWNGTENQVELVTGAPYTGGSAAVSLTAAKMPENAGALPSAAKLLVDGQGVEMPAYVIEGSTYYGLRDLGGALGLAVRWLPEDGSICLYTGLGPAVCLTERSGGDVRAMNRERSTQRWGRICYSYLFGEGDTLSTFDVSGEMGEVLSVDTYDSAAFTLLSSQTIPMELDFFGGFYAGETCNYIVFGCNNIEEAGDKEVIRVVQYTKDFQRLAAVSVTGDQCATLRPFDAGTLRMSEWGNELVIHTSRATYAAGDKLDHESQLTLILNTDPMEVTNDLGLYQGNYVSASYNQFVRHDNGQHVLLDHGSGSPRGIVLHRYDGSSYAASLLLSIPGDNAASCTGVTVGGFEISSGGYLAAMNSVDHQRVAAYTDYALEGLSPDERDIVLLSCGREDPAQVEQIVLTDYAGTGRLGSTPYLVKLSEDRFIVLWEEFTYYETDSGAYGVRDNGVRYVEVDGAGHPLGEIQAMSGARLSYDCQPLYRDGAVVWYVNARAGRLFYTIGA